MHLLAISGSLREASYNKALLRAAARELPDGVELDLFGGLAVIPHYAEETDRAPHHLAVRRLRTAFAATDAILIATPEYNASIPGALKNALDWASRPFPDNCLRRKPVAVIGASTGLFGAVWAQAELRKVLTAIGADVIDSELPIPQAYNAFTDTGSLRDPEHQQALAEIVALLLEAARAPTYRAA